MTEVEPESGPEAGSGRLGTIKGHRTSDPAVLSCGRKLGALPTCRYKSGQLSRRSFLLASFWVADDTLLGDKSAQNSSGFLEGIQNDSYVIEESQNGLRLSKSGSVGECGSRNARSRVGAGIGSGAHPVFTWKYRTAVATDG